MTTKVGPEGQVVIEKEIRDKLGVEPGSLAVQRLVDDHVEIRFLPPVRLHNRSLFGVLEPHITKTVDDEDWQAVREKAWEAAAKDAEKWRLDPENLKP